MPNYRVKPGFTHGAQKQYKAGDTVELTAEEAAGFIDKLELVTGKKAKTNSDEAETAPVDWREAIQSASPQEIADALGVDVGALMALRVGKSAPTVKEGGLIVNPDAVKQVEADLEQETGKDFVATGTNPPTLAETDKGKGKSK